ncbi:MAG: multidrug transporter MatE [Ignavibacteria bacterium RBG_13_36_8]|nr:MAG: multidrug transporter MatE [Ignavibacteria bacterium RBG_13_36_8]
METKIQKWGNSLAIRIPKSFAKEAKLDYNTEVEMTIEEERLIIKPVKYKKYKLSDLLKEITKHNIHKEIDTGQAQGKELL